MASRSSFLVVILCVAVAHSKDVNFGSQCDFSGISVDCLVPLVVDDCNNEDQLSGFIISPDYPSQTNNAQLGKYRVTISSCLNSLISIDLEDQSFSLGTENNFFSVGDGLVVGSNSIPPILRGEGGDNELPDDKPSCQYLSSSNSMWIEANLPEGRAFFKISYKISPLSSEVHYFNESSGVVTSPDYGSSYPTKPDTSLIDVSAGSGENVDLLLTINELDIKGINGDYLKIGQGLDTSVSKNSAVVSWRLSNGVQFLIDGPRAHLLFKVNIPIDVSEDAKGFSIFYQVIEKNLTTPAPSTTPSPTSPTPLPFDSTILLTDLVYLDYVSNLSRPQLVEVLQKYAESTGMLQDGQIFPELSDNSIDILTLKNCYHGWDIDPETCGQVQVIVRAFYQKTDSDEVTYAFPRETVRAAVQMHGSLHQIYLPDDFLDLYWIAGGIALAIIIFLMIGLLVCWRLKLRNEYSKHSSYQELHINNRTTSGSDISKSGPTKNNFEFRTTSAFDNPTFTIEDEEYSNGRPVFTYDPEKSMAQSRSFGHDRMYSPSNPKLKEESELDDEIDMSIHMPSIMLPMSEMPKRGILKSSTLTPADRVTSDFSKPDDHEDILYESSGFREVPLHRFSSSSDSMTSSGSSLPSRTNSISTDQQIASHAVLYGITLTGLDSDDENETNL